MPAQSTAPDRTPTQLLGRPLRSTDFGASASLDAPGARISRLGRPPPTELIVIPTQVRSPMSVFIDATATRPTISFQWAKVRRDAMRWWNERLIESFRDAVREAERTRAPEPLPTEPPPLRTRGLLPPATGTFRVVGPSGTETGSARSGSTRGRSAPRSAPAREDTLIIERPRKNKGPSSRFVAALNRELQIPFAQPLDRASSFVRRLGRRFAAGLARVSAALSSAILRGSARAVVFARVTLQRRDKTTNPPGFLPDPARRA